MIKFQGVAGILISLLFLANTVSAQPDRQFKLYQQNCASCHGAYMEGSPLGPPLVGNEPKEGTNVDDVSRYIAVGNDDRGMPGFDETLNDTDIRSLALLVVESRDGYVPGDLRIATPPALPEGIVRTEKAAFRVETVVEGIDRWPFSIAPLTDGRILVTEKTKGLRIVGADGTLSDLVTGTPPAYDDGISGEFSAGLVFGLGWLLDIVPHPDYDDNGWLYLHHTDRCKNCNARSMISRLPVSMVQIARGRLEGGEWVDHEVLWQRDVKDYTYAPDTNAGGRMAFGPDGHLYFSIGIKGPKNYEGIQELNKPYGKIHRIQDDGSVPADNPFANVEGAVTSTWSLGHRNPQGLEFHPVTGALWETEMGPRGGDEINLIVPGGNYGWPLVSGGLNYDGTPVDYARQLRMKTIPEDLIAPVYDMTPSPAISSFIFYQGDQFAGWEGDIIAGTLKAGDLRRFVLEDGQITHTETLIEDIGRIRDIEQSPSGDILLLLEHAGGSRIVKLVVAE